MRKTPLALFAIALVGCGGSGGSGGERSRTDAPLLAKDESAATPGVAPDDKRASPEDATTPDSRGDSFVDQTDAVRNGPAKYWIEQTGLGQRNNMTWTYVNGGGVSNSMLWKSNQPPGRYEVQVFVPRNYATTRSAKYRMMNGSAVLTTKAVDQYSYSDAWVPLGTFDFSQSPGVYLADDTGESYGTKRMVGFDAVRFLDRTPSGGNGGGGGSAGGGSTGSGISVPEFRQTATAWGSKKMKPSPYMMKDYGCLVTSLSAVAVWAGYGTDPGQFCDWLGGHKGFDNQGNWLSNDNLSNYTGGRARVAGVRTEWESKAADPNVAVGEIDAGRPIVLKVHYKDTTSNSAQHWVVAYAYTRNASGGIDDFKIMDPMGKSAWLKYYYFGSTFQKRIYNAKLVAK